MKSNLLDKTSTLTTINKKSLTKLTDIWEMIMCDTLEDCVLAKEDVAEFDVGFGTVSINIEDHQMRFKFKPSAKFEEELIDTIKNKKNKLRTTIEKSLVEKLTQTYKDLM